MVAVRRLVEGLLHEGVGAMGRGRGLRHGGRAGRAGAARYSCRGALGRAALLERLSRPTIAARLPPAPRPARARASPPPARRPRPAPPARAAAARLRARCPTRRPRARGPTPHIHRCRPTPLHRFILLSQKLSHLSTCNKILPINNLTVAAD